METEKLKVGDVLILIYKYMGFTIGKEYPIKEKNQYGNLILLDDDGDKRNIKNNLDSFKLKGKHIGYIYPFETYCGKNIDDKILLMTSKNDGRYEFTGTLYLIAQEWVETFEKAYEPVEEITIGGETINVDKRSLSVGDYDFGVSKLKKILNWIKTEPNLADKLQLLINKMEGK